MDKSLYVYTKLIDAGFNVEIFNSGKQFNVRDENGIIQTFILLGQSLLTMKVIKYIQFEKKR